METSEEITPVRPAPSKLAALFERLRTNPVSMKELRGRMRGGRAFLLITIYLVVLSGVLGVIILGYNLSSQSPGSLSNMRTIGKVLFGVVLSLEMGMVCFVAPALTAGAISGERERQTFDLLRISLLSEWSLVIGKLFSALSFLLLLLIVSLPLQSLAYLYGGVSIEEVLISFLILIVSAVAFSAIGIFVSSFSKRILTSTVISYLIANLVIFGIPMIVYVLILVVVGNIYPGAWNLNPAQMTTLQIILTITGWLFVVVNPIATAIATELILIQSQSVLIYQMGLNNGATFPVLSPWIGFVVFYLLLSFILVRASVWFVKRDGR